MDFIVVAIGVLANIGLMLGMLCAFVYGYGALNSSVKTITAEIAEIKSDITPRMTDLARLEMVVTTLADAVKGLQETLRGDLVKRLTAVENDVREVMTRCKERGHS